MSAPPPQPDGLFDVDPALIVPAPAKLSPDERRRQGQYDTLAAGYHPLGEVESAFGGLRLHEQAAPLDDRDAPGRRCGNCWFRVVVLWHSKSYAKCQFSGAMGADEVTVSAPPRATRGAASDCKAWWPGCTDHSYGDRRVSDDAARWVPEAAT